MALKRTPKTPAGELPVMAFAHPRAWTAWLDAHHASSKGVWLKLAKKGSGVASVTYAEALEVALAWGWIDGQRKGHDKAAFLQKFTPRGPRSIWSKINREKVLALIEAGAMKPAGLAAVERAKQDGRWEAAYDSPSRAVVPEDFLTALNANPKAQAFFQTLNAANRYAILFRLQTAKKAETRARRIALFVEMLARHEKLHP
ncbi:YdeI/OmpD-associated family protein [Stigmatella aurantiaca]|nr:YdeI/OmpD-associated family protein [Stigmatella aurantiaca]